MAILTACLFAIHVAAMGAFPTILDALTRSGFQDAVTASGAPDLRRELTSSDFGAAADAFAAAYFYADETRGSFLGPLHVSLFDRSSKRWIHADRLADPAGSVMSVAVSAQHVIVNTHQTPSAGRGLVFQRADLGLTAVLQGFHLQPMPGAQVRYSANMVHFAPAHHERLMVFDARSATSTEAFPGVRESALARRYRQRVRTAYARLPEDERREYEKGTNYGPVDDFDRGFSRVAHGGNGRRLALVVHYGHRLPDPQQLEKLETVVSCALTAAPSWYCQEWEVAAFAKSAGVPVGREGDNRVLDGRTLDALLRAALRVNPR